MSSANPSVNVVTKRVVTAVTVSSATDTDSTEVDTLGFTEAHAVLQFGTTTGTSGTATVLLIGSTTSGGTYAAITGATTAALTTDSGGQTNKYVSIPITLIGKRRYIKIRVTTAGTVNTGAMNAWITLGGSVNKGLPAGSTAHPEGGVRGQTAYDTQVDHVV